MRAYVALGFALVFAAAACGSNSSPSASGVASAASPAASAQPSPSPSPAASPSPLDPPSPSPSLSAEEAAGQAYLAVAQAFADAQAEAVPPSRPPRMMSDARLRTPSTWTCTRRPSTGLDAIAFSLALDEKGAALVDALDTVRTVYDFLTEEGKPPSQQVAEDLARFSAGVHAADEAIRADLDCQRRVRYRAELWPAAPASAAEAADDVVQDRQSEAQGVE